MRGSESLAIINQYIATAGGEINAAHRELEALNQRLAEVHRHSTEAYRQLAQFRLDELAANRVVTQLDETDRAMLVLMERRGQALSALEAEIDSSEEKLVRMTDMREKAVQARDDLIKQVDERVAEVMSKLNEQEAYLAQERSVADATAKAEQAETKAAQAEADREEKGRPYREDPLFMYLWRRRYLTPDYAAGIIARILDGRVAKLIRYADARSNYFMLTELPLRLRQHADEQARIAEAELDKIRALEAEALRDEGLTQKKNELQVAQKSLENLDAQMEAEEKQLETFRQQRSAYSNSTDKYSQQAIELQVSELKSDSLADLYAGAQRTPQPDDDISVSRIRDLQKEQSRLTAEIGQLREEEVRRQRSMQELEELRRRFRRRNYDSRHSQFPGGFELAVLLGRLLAGRMSGGGVWDRIRQNQQFRRPRAPRDFGGGIFPGGFGGRGRGGFGGGFGKGGFGGGGGFKTGGGF